MTGDLLNLTALEQARLIATGAVGEHELLDLQRGAIAHRNPILNAFVAVIDHDDVATAVESASDLRGTSFAVKDNIDVRGLPSHAGLRALRARPATTDAPVVARLRAAGLHCLGKLNMHPVALGTTNHNPDFGNALNPWRTTCTPGGSSGGSGAAVAAGLCGLALGTDTMGSVRIPAAHCGVVGFKPSAGVIATNGVFPLSTLLDCVGLLGRSVGDIAAAFAVVSAGVAPTSKADAHDATRTRRATTDTRGATRSDRAETTGALFDETLRPFAMPGPFAVPENLDALALEAEVRTAFDQGLKRLQQRGARIVPLDLSDYPFTRLRRAGLVLCETELLTTLAEPLRERRDEIPGDLLAMLDFGASRSGADVARLLAEVVRWGQWLDRELLPFEGLLMPATAHVAFPLDAPVPHDHADFTAMANMSGGPSISLPLPVPAGSLPVGLQLTGRRGDDLRLLDNAQWIEQILRSGNHGN